MSLFPIFLKLEGRACLVVGAGRIGESKIEGLLAAGAAVRVVAPEATSKVQEWASAERLTWHAREFDPADLEGVVLVVVATSRRELNERVFQAAAKRGIWCNVVDDPPRCDFYYPAVVRRGDLQIAISTNGKSPALAQRLRRELEDQFGPQYAGWLEELGRERQELMPQVADAELRHERLHSLASAESFEEYQRQRRATGSRTPTLAPAPKARGRVYLVGAGPGDPDLLTVKAARVLREADVVLHDDLVPAPILDLASPAAQILNVGKRCGRKHIAQEEISALMIGYAREGLTLVRLKGGDPLTFGRAGEEIVALREAVIEFEVVPGVTAASAAAAAAEISLTERQVASSVIFLTGHHCAERSGKTPTEWPALVDGKLSTGATIVVYMPGDNLAPLTRQLRAAGLAADTPCLIVSRLGMDDQRFERATLERLANVAPLPSPKVLIIGAVVGARPDARESTAREQNERPLVTTSAG